MLTIGMPGGKSVIVPESLQIALEQYVSANVIEATTPKGKRTNEVLAQQSRARRAAYNAFYAELAAFVANPREVWPVPQIPKGVNAETRVFPTRTEEAEFYDQLNNKRG
jgi:hypothetical protein